MTERDSPATNRNVLTIPDQRSRQKCSRRHFLATSAVAAALTTNPTFASVGQSPIGQSLREIIFGDVIIGHAPNSKTRVLAIGCVELINRKPTGRNYHQYINPARESPPCFATAESPVDVLAEYEDMIKSNRPTRIFEEIVDDFLGFVGDSRLLGYSSRPFYWIDAELIGLGRLTLKNTPVLNIEHLAMKKFPGANPSLKALCKRFQIGHNAKRMSNSLSQAKLLAEIYPHIVGGSV